MKTIAKTILLFLLSALAAPGINAATDTAPLKAKLERVDTSDPKAVATAFIDAVANKNVPEAAQYVIPEERDAIKKELANPPPLPKEPDIRVTVKGDRAGVDILNAKGFGLNMTFRDGRWWIVK